MNKGTGLLYTGNEPVYAFKRTVANGTFISLEELFKLTGKQSGYSNPNIKFLEWFFHNKVAGLKNFDLLIDQGDFNEDGSFRKEGVIEKNPETVLNLKSSQIVLQDEFSAEPAGVIEPPKMEKADNSYGSVTVTSSEIQVSDSVEKATQSLREQAKAMHVDNKDKRGTIVDSRPEKETKVVQSTVITGDDFKKKSSNASRAVVLDKNHSPVGVESIPENMKFAYNTEQSNTFVLSPPVAESGRDVMSNPVVNYGGNSTKLEKTSIEPTAPKESIGENLMSQPAMTASDNLKQVISLDSIVRNPSKLAALEAINKCRDYHMLKIASKQLRSSGDKPELEKAVQRRLTVVPPGSVG